MDILKNIENQINAIKSEQPSNFIDFIYSHLQRAENYYLQGKNEDDQYFNDVIYRVNQSYEGALK